MVRARATPAHCTCVVRARAQLPRSAPAHGQACAQLAAPANTCNLLCMRKWPPAWLHVQFFNMPAALGPQRSCQPSGLVYILSEGVGAAPRGLRRSWRGPRPEGPKTMKAAIVSMQLDELGRIDPSSSTHALASSLARWQARPSCQGWHRIDPNQHYRAGRIYVLYTIAMRPNHSKLINRT